MEIQSVDAALFGGANIRVLVFGKILFFVFAPGQKPLSDSTRMGPVCHVAAETVEYVRGAWQCWHDVLHSLAILLYIKKRQL